MGIKSLFGFGQARDKPVDKAADAGYSFLFGRTTSGKPVNERTAMQTTAVYACVRILAEAVASLPLHVYEYQDDGGKKLVHDHPLYYLLHDEPNPEMSSFVFRETLMTHLLLWGNAYAQIIRNGKGKRPEGYVEPPLEELAKLRKPEEPEEVPDLKGAASPLAAALEAVFNGETPQYEGVGAERPSGGSSRSRERRRSSRSRRSGGRPQEGEKPAREGGQPKEKQQHHRGEQRKPRPEQPLKSGENQEKASGKSAQEPGEKRSRPRRRRPRSGGGGKPQTGSTGQE